MCRRRHGGGAPQVRRAAAQRLQYLEAEGEVARLLRETKVPGGTHPLDGLLEVVERTGGMVKLLGGLVGKLDTDPATTWETVAVGKDAHREIRTNANAALTGYDDRGNQVPDVHVELYGRWQGRYLRACKTALDADIDERAIRNQTATVDTFLRAIQDGFDAAGLSPQQRDVFRNAVAKELRRVGAMSELVPNP